MCVSRNPFWQQRSARLTLSAQQHSEDGIAIDGASKSLANSLIRSCRMIRRKCERDDLYRSGEYSCGTVRWARLCRITLNRIGATELEIVHLVRERPAHLNAD